MLNRKQAQALTRRLDKISNHVESRYAEIGLSEKEAYNFCLYLDQTSDLLERSSEDHGDEQEDEDEEVDAATLQRDMDEQYMDTFDSPHQPHQMDADEPYMRQFENDPSQIMDDNDLSPVNDGDWDVSASGEDNWYTRSTRSASESNWYTRGQR